MRVPRPAAPGEPIAIAGRIGFVATSNHRREPIDRSRYCRWLAICVVAVIGQREAFAGSCPPASPACHLENGKQLLRAEPRRAADELLASYQLDERTDTLVLYATALQLDHRYALDNSSGRIAYDQMASQLDVLRSQLVGVDGQLPGLHVGVVTTDLGTRGRLDDAPAPPIGNCAGDGDAGKLVALGGGLSFGDFLEDLRGPGDTRIRNFDSDLPGAIARLTNPAPGTANAGCEFIQPLEAMRRALDPDTNPDFLRPDARLAVVFLTSKDDCSLARGALLDPLDATLGPPFSFRCTEQGVICDPDDPRRPGLHRNCRPRDGSPFLVDVGEYQRFLSRLKPDPHDVMVSAVAGPRTSFEVRDIGLPTLAPSCQGGGGSAMPAVRIGALVDAFGGALINACTQDAAYQKITARIADAQRSCFPGLRRSDGENCMVTELAGGLPTTLARCADGSSAPCWYTYQDAAACSTGDHVGIGIDRGGAMAPPRSRIQATCFAR